MPVLRHHWPDRALTGSQRMRERLWSPEWFRRTRRVHERDTVGRARIVIGCRSVECAAAFVFFTVVAESNTTVVSGGTRTAALPRIDEARLHRTDQRRVRAAFAPRLRADNRVADDDGGIWGRRARAANVRRRPLNAPNSDPRSRAGRGGDVQLCSRAGSGHERSLDPRFLKTDDEPSAMPVWARRQGASA